MQKAASRPGEFKIIARSLRASLPELGKNDPLRLAGATAFFTTFALPPILYIIIQLFGLFFDRRNLGREMLDGVAHTLGKDGAGQVRQVLRSIRGFGDSWYVIVIGFIFLLFVATTLFNVIKNSLNQIWQIGIIDKPGILFGLSLRLRSFAVILFAGLLFIVDLLSESLQVIAGDYIESLWKGVGSYFKSALHEVAGIIIVATWFIVLFRYLADGRPGWRASLVGGLLTGILFTIGKMLLQFLLINSNIGKLYGASGSIVLVLLFVFYSSFILYYGACFIYCYSTEKEMPIHLNGKAYSYKIEQVDEEPCSPATDQH
jgi:membrane protein